MAAQYAYVMKSLTKTFPGANKPTLSNWSMPLTWSALTPTPLAVTWMCGCM